MNADAFLDDNHGHKKNGTTGTSGNNNRDGGRPNLRAHVRQAVFGGEAYDMRTFQGQDLTQLFHVIAAGDIPTFEVVVEDCPIKNIINNDDEDDEASAPGSPIHTNAERWD
jgi:hypothetical protein